MLWRFRSTRCSDILQASVLSSSRSLFFSGFNARGLQVEPSASFRSRGALLRVLLSYTNDSRCVSPTIFRRTGPSAYQVVQDGTINYLSLPAIVDGLRMLSAYMPFLPLRLSALTHYAISSLNSVAHGSSGGPVVKILSRHPSKRLKFVGEQADTGSIISAIFLGVC